MLAQLGLTLAGELPWQSGSATVVEPAYTDGPTFLSSNAATVAVASLAVVRLGDLLRSAEQVAALSHLAPRGSVAAYDARVHAAKDDPFASSVAARMRTLLDGAERDSARLQDPFGLRALPQVHGAAEVAVATAEQVLVSEIGAAAENPLVPADLLARARTLSSPVTAGRTVVSLGLEEHASHSTWSARLCVDLGDLVPSLLACELEAAAAVLQSSSGRSSSA